jgi:flavodoxin
MKALVVYDSVYGNTEQIARAIGSALGSPEEVEVRRVGEVQPEQLVGLELLIAGSPTQRFRPLPAVSNWLKSLPPNGLKGVKVTAFDTRIPQAEIDKYGALAFFVKLFGYAAQPIAKSLGKKGGCLVAAPEGFYVNGTEGPLADGELERAADWARQLTAD